MELEARNKSLAEVKGLNSKLILAVAGLVLVVLLLAIRIVMQSQIVVMQTPGMPAATIIEKAAMDKSGQMATLTTVTAALVQVNPANKDFQKRLLQEFLAPAAYTPISMEIERKAKLLETQRELGSYYFVQRAYTYDPAIDRHFVMGDVHTVNASRDSAVPYVYEYQVHVENYRLWVDQIVVYEGDKPHDSDWIKANKR